MPPTPIMWKSEASERYSIVGRIRSISVFHLLLEMQ